MFTLMLIVCIYVAEVENNGTTVLPAISQSANFCMSLYANGVARERCIFPVVTNAGITVCFGAIIIMLDETFPTYILLSKQSDLLDEYEKRVTSASLERIKHHLLLISKLQKNIELNL